MARRAVKSPKSYDMMDMGAEPEWDDQNELSDIELRTRFGESINWFNYNYNNNRHPQDFIVKYLKSAKAPKKEISAIRALESWKISPVYGCIAKMILNGCEFPSVLAKCRGDFDAKVADLVQEGSKILSHKKQVTENLSKKAPVISIQARTRNAAREVIGHIEGDIDSFIESGCKEKISIYDYLQRAEVKGGYMTYVIEHFQPIYQELQEALKGGDEDLNEGYAFLSKPRKKKLVAFYANILSDCQEWQKDCRGKRKTRKRKVKTPKELVKSLKFKPKDEDFGIESVKPTDIIGASQVWAFDTKTRFLHKYVSDVGMAVKGSTLKEFDKNQSFKKKIREMYCEQVLDDVVNGGKVKLRKVLDSIAAKEVAVTGRIGKEMVVVRVVK